MATMNLLIIEADIRIVERGVRRRMVNGEKRVVPPRRSQSTAISDEHDQFTLAAATARSPVDGFPTTVRSSNPRDNFVKQR